MNSLLSSEFLKIALPLLAGILAWLANEERKRKWEEYKRKEERYIPLLRSLKGFYANADLTSDQARKLKDEFLNQLNLCWLYCPDEVIRKGYSFLQTVFMGESRTDEEKQKALGDFILSLRKDLFACRFWLLRRTSLSVEDFKSLKAT